MRNNLFTLWKQHEIKTKRDIPMAQLAREIGIQLPTLKRWLDQDITRYDEPIIMAMMDYFDIDDIGELLIVERETA